MGTSGWSVVDLLVTAIPIVIAVIAVRIGSAQMREFSEHTGDKGLLAHIAAFSLLRRGSDKSSPPAPVATPGEKNEARREKALHHA